MSSAIIYIIAGYAALMLFVYLIQERFIQAREIKIGFRL